MFKRFNLNAILVLILSALMGAPIKTVSNEPGLRQVPQSLASIKGQQLKKLVGFKVREKNSELEKRERKLMASIEKWFEENLSDNTSLPKLAVICFLVGVLTSLTPCVYPMIPVSAVILSSNASSTGFMMHAAKSISYIFGIATVHAGLGYTAATTGMLFGQWLANIYVVMLLILFFLFLALSMFGFYSINFKFGSAEIPKKRSLFATFFYGLLVGLASSPCLSPILAILLGFVGSISNPASGIVMLFSFSLGVNLILMLVGFSSGILSSLPRPGAWMIEINKILGFLMLFGCVYFAAPFLQRYHVLFLCSLIMFLAFIYYAHSINSERMFYFMKKHQAQDSHERASIFDTISILMIIKLLLALITLGLGIYLGYTALLIYKKTTTMKLFTKLLLN